MWIDKIKINGKLLLAPMANVTNPAFRKLCKKYGACVTYSEMVSADAILYKNDKTIFRSLKYSTEKPFAIQIFGNSASNIGNAASIIEDKYSPDIIDINFGCPAHTLIKNGSGSALLHYPDKIQNIMTMIHKKVNTPITAKIRVLYDMDKTLKIAKIIENTGASAISVHGRTQSQQYSGKADHIYAKKIKNELSIPVIANGDIVDGISAQNILKYTNCDALMIGRAAIGNPYIFAQIGYFLKTGKQLHTNLSLQRIRDFNNYVELLKLYDLYKYIDLKMQACWFTKELENGRHIRKIISEMDTKEEIVHLMKNLNDEKLIL